eukprot:COSAG04_NODE_3635_length_2655_cov_2.605634_3_plen_84_part_00
MGTLNAGYYVTDGGKHCQLRLWGSSGWFHFELDGRPRPLVWQSNHPSAPEARPPPPPPPTLPHQHTHTTTTTHRPHPRPSSRL